MTMNEIYFLFLILKIKYNNEVLNIADQQNMHSVSIAVNIVVKLYRVMFCQDKLH